MTMSDGGRPGTSRSRRAFLGSAGGGAFSFLVVPRHVLGGADFVAANDRIHVAGIGAGGMGGGDVATVSRLGANIVALCDVDEQRAAGTFQAFPQARRDKDLRILLDREAKHIDAVTVGTPDHVHAVAAMGALRAGKHVYCQKPLTRTLRECRKLAEAARAAGVANQMGNQGHASEGSRLTNEWIQAGVIGGRVRGRLPPDEGRPRPRLFPVLGEQKTSACASTSVAGCKRSPAEPYGSAGLRHQGAQSSSTSNSVCISSARQATERTQAARRPSMIDFRNIPMRRSSRPTIVLPLPAQAIAMPGHLAGDRPRPKNEPTITLRGPHPEHAPDACA